MRTTCDNCKCDVEVSMYFNNARIVTETCHRILEEDYIAMIDGKAICPVCGHYIYKIFHQRITDDDILWLTTGEISKELIRRKNW